MSAIFTYNQDSALKAGVSDFINESGAYAGKIPSAKWTHGSSGSKSAALELSLDTPDGKANYLSIWYKKKDGTDSPSGIAMINAIMGITRVAQLGYVQSGDEFICPELQGKDIGFVLQKVLKSKTSGEDTYSFEIKMPFHHQTRQTLNELVAKSQPLTVDAMLSTLKDKDDRKKPQAGYVSPMQSNAGSNLPPIEDGLDNVGW